MWVGQSCPTKPRRKGGAFLSSLEFVIPKKIIRSANDLRSRETCFSQPVGEVSYQGMASAVPLSIKLRQSATNGSRVPTEMPGAPSFAFFAKGGIPQTSSPIRQARISYCRSPRSPGRPAAHPSAPRFSRFRPGEKCRCRPRRSLLAIADSSAVPHSCPQRSRA